MSSYHCFKFKGKASRVFLCVGIVLIQTEIKTKSSHCNQRCPAAVRNVLKQELLLFQLCVDAKSIWGTDLPTHFQALLHWNESCWSNWLFPQVTEYWHQANSPRTDPVMLCAWQGSHYSVSCLEPYLVPIASDQSTVWSVLPWGNHSKAILQSHCPSSYEKAMQNQQVAMKTFVTISNLPNWCEDYRQSLLWGAIL